MRSVIFFFCIFAAQLSLKAYAYPELSRHGYTNCTSCHLSPSGGGLLTPYGRELSKEILSTWAKDGEQYFAYGKLSTDEKTLLGAYVRGLQAIRDDKNTQVARAILMQADAELGYNEKKWAIAGTIGRQEIRSGQKADGRVFSRRHYFLYRSNDALAFRIGKFLHFYGLNDANHNLYVRKDLNFGFDTETYNFEASYLGDSWAAYITYINGPLSDQYSPLKERAATASMSYFFNERQKIGMSIYRGEDDLNKRLVAGPWLILSLAQKVYLLSEFNWQFKNIKATQAKQNGYVTSHRLNYEWMQGLISFLSFDKKYLNSNDPNSEQNAYGIGVQFFPRPHFELVTSWQKEELINAKSTSDLYWLMLHFYL